MLGLNLEQQAYLVDGGLLSTFLGHYKTPHAPIANAPHAEGRKGKCCKGKCYCVGLGASEKLAAVRQARQHHRRPKIAHTGLCTCFGHERPWSRIQRQLRDIGGTAWRFE